MKQIIPIVVATDKKYMIPTKVTLWSMLKSLKSGCFVKAYILCSSLFEDKCREELRLLEKNNKNIAIEFLEVNAGMFANARMLGHISIVSCYRLLIAELLREEKCIYLDVDIIVNRDISSLYSIDMGDSYVAGVKDCNFQRDLDLLEPHRKAIDIPTLKGYVNAGVLVFNLQKIREDHLTDSFLQYVKNGYPMMDQDIINKACFGKIKYLDLKYNTFAHFYLDCQKLRGTTFSEEEILEAETLPVIIHCAGRFKPWDNIRFKVSQLWWDCAREVIDGETFDEMYRLCSEKTYQGDWSYILEKSKSAEQIVIAGFSDMGRRVFDSLNRCGVKKVQCFCDNSPEKQMQSYQGLQVFPPAQIVKKYTEALWINTSKRYAEEITEQLKELGVSLDRIIFYHKTKVYYELLEEHYLEYEQKQLELMRQGIPSKKESV